MSADNWAQCPERLTDVNHTADYVFREDYEIYGAEAGTVRVNYWGHCSECGAGLDFKIERVIPDV